MKTAAAKLTLVCVTCLVLVSIASVEAGKITWNFENQDELSDFEILKSDWKIEDGKLIGTVTEPSGTTAYGIVTGSSEWEDYAIEAELTIPEGAYCYFNFRIKDERDFMLAELNWVPSVIFYQIADGGGTNRNPTGGLDDFPLPDDYTETHVWKLDVQGDEITLYMDGEELASLVVAEIEPTGKIGFGGDIWTSATGENVLEFEYISVEGPTIPGNFEGHYHGEAVEPTGKLAATWGQIKAGY